MTREEAIEILDTDEGINEEEWDAIAPNIDEDLRIQVRATEGRFYLPSDFINKA
jgi:hypothetical protein